MAEGRQRSEWDRASSQIAATINSAPRKKGAKPVKPTQVHPFHAQPEPKKRGFRAIKEGL